jgi:endo-1,4-beta-xylanase
MHRRSFLRTAALAAGARAAGIAVPLRLDTLLATDPTLKARAAAKGILFGAAAGQSLFRDPAYQEAFIRECAILTPETALKMNAVRPQPDQFNFTAADQMFQFAQSNGMKFHGHTLVWHQSLPSWFQGYATAQNARQLMTQHIQTVCAHYAGKVHSWDVVNEVLNPDDHNPNGLRTSPWLSLIGPDYIPLAFETARQADPQALLVYNDGGVEYDWAPHEAKRTAVLKFLENLKKQNVPIQAFGFEGHLFGGDSTRHIKPQIISNFFRSISDMGYKILLSEIDVWDKTPLSDPKARDQDVADTVSALLEPALDNPAVIVLEVWALSDKYTWLSQHAARPDGQPVRVAPLDSNFNPKPVYQAIARALDGAPARPA